MIIYNSKSILHILAAGWYFTLSITIDRFYWWACLLKITHNAASNILVCRYYQIALQWRQNFTSVFQVHCFPKSSPTFGFLERFDFWQSDGFDVISLQLCISDYKCSWVSCHMHDNLISFHFYLLSIHIIFFCADTFLIHLQKLAVDSRQKSWILAI